MKFLQLNLNHCQTAQELLSQGVLEHEIDVAIICEYYKDFHSGVFVSDRSGKAAIWTCGNRAIENTSNRIEDGFTRAKVGGIHVFSCYAAPSLTLDEFALMLEKLASEASRYNPIITLGPKIEEVAKQVLEAAYCSKYFHV